eukprot:Clim_evm15s18 gene=Clim_evmTU15s18
MGSEPKKRALPAPLTRLSGADGECLLKRARTHSMGMEDYAQTEEDNPGVEVDFASVSRAAKLIKSGIKTTPLELASDALCKESGMEIWFKKDIFLPTGSFKERGARNALLCLSKEAREKGVVAASAGNHALALSYHGKKLGIPVTVVMPQNAPLAKSSRCISYGAEVISYGQHIGESKEYAQGLVEERGLTYINGYNDVEIIAGAGSMALEIVNQMEEDIDAMIIPVGGGGLIAGCAVALKTLIPSIQIIGVEPQRCASFKKALEAGRPVPVDVTPTLADGLAVPTVGSNAFATGRKYIDKIVTVTEHCIAKTVLRLVENEKLIVEGAGCTGLAACVTKGLLPDLEGKRVVVPLCGANVDTTVLGRCLDRGLAADHRLCRFVVTVPDRPGGISNLTAILDQMGASIKDIFHERAWLDSDIFSVEVKVIVETRNKEHSEELRKVLRSTYQKFFWMPLYLDQPDCTK